MPANPRFIGAPLFGRAASWFWEFSDAANYVPAVINIVISNVPGPKTMRYSNGARMLTHFPVSIPAHGSGVNITVQSYAEHFDVGITACAATVPDLAQFRDDTASETDCPHVGPNHRALGLHLAAIARILSADRRGRVDPGTAEIKAILNRTSHDERTRLPLHQRFSL